MLLVSFGSLLIVFGYIEGAAARIRCDLSAASRRDVVSMFAATRSHVPHISVGMDLVCEI